MSRTLLSKRLQDLERSGVVERTGSEGYRLTAAGAELGPIVVQLGQWGKQWTRSELNQQDLDPGLLMWDMRRRIDLNNLPDEKIVVHFLYPDAPMGKKAWWLVLECHEVDLCLVDPGLTPNLHVTSSVSIMTSIWMGDLSFGAALQSGDLQIAGPTKLRTRLPAWLRLSTFADVERRIG